MLIFLAIPAALIAGLLGFAATRPGTMRIQRSTTIAAPPERILPLLTDFRRWADWSPYEKLDPSMKKTYSGAATGTGAVYAWEGNKKAGAGRMEITATTPARVSLQLDFSRPFEAHNTTDFALQPAGAGTQVTWSMDGPALFMSKLMGIFIDMDKLIGKDFETGLAALKTLAEGQPASS